MNNTNLAKSPQPQRRKWRNLLVVLALVCAGFGASFYAIKSRQAEAYLNALNKRKVKISRTHVRKELALTGKVLPLSSVAVYSPVSGQLKELLVSEGDAVEKDQPLFSVIQDSSGQRELEAAENEAARARLESRVAEEQLTRRKEVKDLFSDSENERLENEADRRKLELNAALQRLSLLRDRLGLPATSAKSPPRAERNSSKSGDPVIYMKSPKQGIVTFANKSVGESVLANSENADIAGREVLTISDLEKMMVRSRILESDLALVKEKMPAQIRLDAFRDKEYQGTVSRISLQGVDDKTAGYTYFVTDVIFSMPDANVRSQMNATIRLLVAERLNVLALPTNAVATLGSHSVVELIPKDKSEKGKPRYRKVSTGLVTESLVEITSQDIQEGDEFLEIDFSTLDLGALNQGKLGEAEPLSEESGNTPEAASDRKKNDKSDDQL